MQVPLGRKEGALLEEGSAIFGTRKTQLPQKGWVVPAMRQPG